MLYFSSFAAVVPCPLKYRTILCPYIQVGILFIVLFLCRVGHIHESAAVGGRAAPGVQEDPADSRGGVVPGGGPVGSVVEARGAGGWQGGDGQIDCEAVCRRG